MRPAGKIIGLTIGILALPVCAAFVVSAAGGPTWAWVATLMVLVRVELLDRTLYTIVASILEGVQAGLESWW